MTYESVGFIDEDTVLIGLAYWRIVFLVLLHIFVCIYYQLQISYQIIMKISFLSFNALR